MRSIKTASARGKRWLSRVITGVLIMTMVLPAYAASQCTVLQTGTGEETVNLYVKGIEGDVIETSYQIGANVCETIEMHRLAELDIPMQTLILWDNSLSISTKNREKIKDILYGLVADHMEREQLCIAAISDTITPLSDFSTNYEELNGIIKAAAYENKDAYIMDTVYQAVELLNSLGSNAYKRIILISDGMDNKSLGYTETEIYKMLEKNNYPIHILGSLNGTHTEELQKLFALGRSTGGGVYNLDDVKEASEVTASLGADKNILSVTAVIPLAQRDGGIYNSKLTVQSSGGEYEATASVEMPFAAGAAAPTQTAESETETEEETEEETETETEEEKELIPALPEQDNTPFFIIIGAAVLIILASGGIAFAVIMRKRKKVPDFTGFTPEIQASGNSEAERTVMIRSVDEELDEEATVLIFAEKEIIMTITDCKDSAKTFRCKLDKPVIIGRKPGLCTVAFENEGTVSKKHCEITMVNGRYYVKDLGSINHTRIGEKEITESQEIFDGTILKLGQLSLQVKFR